MKNKLAIAVSSALFLSACGGGSGSSSTEDTTAPVISLTGDNPVTVNVGDAYTDAGASAEDDIDGSVSVITTGTVDTANPEKYTLTYSATDQAGNEATPVTRDVYVSPPSEDGSSSMQVMDGRLLMEVAWNADPSIEEENSREYGIYTEEEDHLLTQSNTSFRSVEGEVNLIETSFTGDSRPRIVLAMDFVSESTVETMHLYILFDERASGVTTRSYINTSTAGESSVSGIHRLPQEKGTPVTYKIELLDDSVNFAKMSVGEASALIPLSALPASDMQFVNATFRTYVKGGEPNYFAKASLDNVVLTYVEDGVEKTETRNFNGLPDGKLPLPDAVFNNVFDGS